MALNLPEHTKSRTMYGLINNVLSKDRLTRVRQVQSLQQEATASNSGEKVISLFGDYAFVSGDDASFGRVLRMRKKGETNRKVE